MLFCGLQNKLWKALLLITIELLKLTHCVTIFRSDLEMTVNGLPRNFQAIPWNSTEWPKQISDVTFGMAFLNLEPHPQSLVLLFNKITLEKINKNKNSNSIEWPTQISDVTLGMTWGRLVFKGGYDAHTRKHIKRVIFFPTINVHPYIEKSVKNNKIWGKKGGVFQPSKLWYLFRV